MNARLLALPVVLSVFGAAACGADAASTASGKPTPKVSASGTASPATSATASAAPSGRSGSPCVVGTWRAAGVQSGSSLGTVTGRAAGGGGVTMTVGAGGRTEVGFDRSEPVTFTAAAGGASLRGQVKYSGSLHGTVQFEPGTKGSGQWQPQAGAAGDKLRVTVKLTDPVSVTLLKNAGIGDLAGAEDGLDRLPILRGGTYQCAADRLRVRTDRDGPTLTWTFTRTA